MRTQYENNWASDFGNDYTKRCDVDYKERVGIFKELFDGLQVNYGSVLEVGCNKGHNLQAINDFAITRTFGLDINKEALELSSESNYKSNLILGQADELPWLDNSFDLVFTAGVLIHIPTEKVEKVMRELHRVSSRYVMMIEYPNETEEGRNYRDITDKSFGVWSRPFGKMFQEFFPNAKLVKTGHMKDMGSDKWHFTAICDYWIYEK